MKKILVFCMFLSALSVAQAFDGILTLAPGQALTSDELRKVVNENTTIVCSKSEPAPNVYCTCTRVDSENKYQLIRHAAGATQVLAEFYGKVFLNSNADSCSVAMQRTASCSR